MRLLFWWNHHTSHCIDILTYTRKDPTMFRILLLKIFVYIGIYTTISTIWRLYELRKYKEIRPNHRDILTAMILAAILYILLTWKNIVNENSLTIFLFCYYVHYFFFLDFFSGNGWFTCVFPTATVNGLKLQQSSGFGWKCYFSISMFPYHEHTIISDF